MSEESAHEIRKVRYSLAWSRYYLMLSFVQGMLDFTAVEVEHEAYLFLPDEPDIYDDTLTVLTPPVFVITPFTISNLCGG
jgi:hypothetical protein